MARAQAHRVQALENALARMRWQWYTGPHTSAYASMARPEAATRIMRGVIAWYTRGVLRCSDRNARRLEKISFTPPVAMWRTFVTRGRFGLIMELFEFDDIPKRVHVRLFSKTILRYYCWPKIRIIRISEFVRIIRIVGIDEIFRSNFWILKTTKIIFCIFSDFQNLFKSKW